MKKLKVALIGYGNRGCIYGSFILSKKEQFEVVAVVEFLKEKRKKAQKDFSLTDNQVFENADDFFNAKLKVDLLIIASMDQYHYKQAMQALHLDMHILLEKPIALTLQECEDIEALASKKNKAVVICHVLRYSSFYVTIKNAIENKEIGEVVHIAQTENVGYWHQAHSYVRGNWRNKDITGPMILAKCSHDLDILYWLINQPCINVSSYGSLKHFNHENQPREAANRCFECALKESCPFNCFKFYLGFGREWARQLVGDDLSDENITNYLKVSPYGRCVYSCDNNVVDHQVVNMLFQNQVTASLTMNAFSRYCDRTIHIYGTQGEIIGDFENRLITIQPFLKEKKVIDLNQISDDFSGHGGGDRLMFFEFVDYLLTQKWTKGLSFIQDSIMSHKMAFAAEESRLQNGKPIKIK